MTLDRIFVLLLAYQLLFFDYFQRPNSCISVRAEIRFSVRAEIRFSGLYVLKYDLDPTFHNDFRSYFCAFVDVSATFLLRACLVCA